MPKMKTHKGVKARVKISGTGKLIGRRAGKRHLLGAKSTKIKRKMRRPLPMKKAEETRLKLLLPYN